jgi:hypothetical protein
MFHVKFVAPNKINIICIFTSYSILLFITIKHQSELHHKMQNAFNYDMLCNMITLLTSPNQH